MSLDNNLDDIAGMNSAFKLRFTLSMNAWLGSDDDDGSTVVLVLTLQTVQILH